LQSNKISIELQIELIFLAVPGNGAKNLIGKIASVLFSTDVVIKVEVIQVSITRTAVAI